MSAMEPPASEPPRTDTGETFFKTPDAPPGFHFRQVIMPGVASSPILPEWLSSRLSRLFKRATPSH